MPFFPSVVRLISATDIAATSDAVASAAAKSAILGQRFDLTLICINLGFVQCGRRNNWYQMKTRRGPRLHNCSG